MRFNCGANVRFHLACASVRKNLLLEAHQSCRDNLAFLRVEPASQRLIPQGERWLHRLVSLSEISSADILIFTAPSEAQLAEAPELDAVVASHTSGLAVASQMNLYRCDH
jgi:hypothetical protein